MLRSSTSFIPWGIDGEVCATPVGLRISATVSFDRWEDLGARLGRMVSSSAWYIGDWINFGESHYADRYRRALDAVGLRYQTLRNYAWVARSVELSRRRDTLSFQHHMEIAKLTSADQIRWLDRAAHQHWSAAQLRQHLKGELVADLGSPPAHQAVVPTIVADAERIDRWRTAARNNHQELRHWIVTILDDAAGRDPRDQAAIHDRRAHIDAFTRKSFDPSE